MNEETPYDEIRRTEYWNSSFEAPIGAPYPRDILMTCAHVIVDILNFLFKKFAFSKLIVLLLKSSWIKGGALGVWFSIYATFLNIAIHL